MPTSVPEFRIIRPLLAGLPMALDGSNILDRWPLEARVAEYRVRTFDDSFGVRGGFYYIRTCSTF